MDGWIFQSFPFGVSPYLQGQKLLVSGSVFPVRDAFPPFQRCFSGFICNFKSQVKTPKCRERAVFSKLYAKMIKFRWFWGGDLADIFSWAKPVTSPFLLLQLLKTIPDIPVSHLHLGGPSHSRRGPYACKALVATMLRLGFFAPVKFREGSIAIRFGGANGWFVM